jgi:hypothetical protein
MSPVGDIVQVGQLEAGASWRGAAGGWQRVTVEEAADGPVGGEDLPAVFAAARAEDGSAREHSGGRRAASDV